ncbi:MAG: LTA synthase family protein [Mariniphaga sp.]|nr:LTA synthase family protein [Mariniphaga sp.]MDD4224979.1 LTA synthase family protein [Mariniphaga sp.]
MVHKINRENTLGDHFYDFDQAPHIVLLIIEGLSDDFLHEYKGSLFMPFLHQLKDKSLYWKRCFTLGERSFAVMPSILGGLPYGDKGFTLQERLPRHLSLVSILNSNGYHTTFFYGQGAWFHQKDRFFRHNDMDLIFDNNKFSEEYNKIIVGNDNFFWGYNDKDLLNQSLKVIDTLKQDKRLDIYFTGTSHSPFAISNEEYYNNKLKEITSESYRDFHQTYSKYLMSLLFVDDALKNFFAEYEKRPDYPNTIFVITGDHPMTEVPVANSLKRYHVPLLIFSEKLRDHHLFTQTVSHLDVPESILSMLKDYLTTIPSISTSLGEQLITPKKKYPKNLAFMNDNRDIVDFLYENYFLSQGDLYQVDSSLHITKMENDSIQAMLDKKLNTFKNTSLYVSRNNKIISSELFCRELNHQKIFEWQKTDTLHTSSEYFTLTDEIRIPHSDFIFDISLYMESNKNDEVSIVYQITNSNDSLLLWKNLGVNNHKITQAHIPVHTISDQDTALFFKSYIWNNNKNDLIFSDIDVLLYSPKSN